MIQKEYSLGIFGKIKTTCLFITIILAILLYYVPSIYMIVQGFSYLSINLQILSLLEYSINFYDNMHPITVEDNPMHQQIMEEALEQKTIVLDHLNQLIETYEQSK